MVFREPSKRLERKESMKNNIEVTKYFGPNYKFEPAGDRHALTISIFHRVALLTQDNITSLFFLYFLTMYLTPTLPILLSSYSF